jgi:hypothetical protein
MVFRVDLEQFAEAVRTHLKSNVAAVATRENRTVITAGDPEQRVVVAAASSKPAAKVREMLIEAGLTVTSGEWTESNEWALEPCEEQDAYIAAVAYKSREEMPGLWLDAFPYEPSNGEILKALYDEFSEAGHLDSVPFEEFVRLSAANIVVLRPEDVARFLRGRATS